MNSFGQILRQHREARGFGVRELAALSSTTAATISLVENGERSPPAESVARWADALGLSAGERGDFWMSAFRQRVGGDERLLPYLEQLESRMAGMAAALAAVAIVCQQRGVELPQALVEKIEALAKAK